MNYSIFLLLFIIINPLYAQLIFEGQILNPLQKEPLPSEKVFVHRNKKSYFPQDVIWFQAFVSNAGNKPSLKTTRLHVNLLNAEGIIISAKNVFIENGAGSGQFDFKRDLKPERYFIQAYTQNMRNFGEQTYFLQELHVQGLGKTTQTTSRNSYEIQILPEGGYFVKNTTGAAVIKALKNGFGIDFSAKIVNRENQILQQFSNTHLGMAKFDLNFEENETYTAIIKFKDTLIERRLPETKKEGIVLNLDNTQENYLKIYLKTNKNTLKSDFNTGFALLCHQRNNVGAHIPFTKLNSLNAEIVLNKANLKEGVNTITLFKDDQPIASRSFFVEKQDSKIDLELQKLSPGAGALDML